VVRASGQDGGPVKPGGRVVPPPRRHGTLGASLQLGLSLVLVVLGAVRLLTGNGAFFLALGALSLSPALYRIVRRWRST
jgi:hypothetical protein